MTVYYITQDNTIWGCGDPECCGQYYEDIDKMFVYFEEEPADAEAIQYQIGGGSVLKYRKATKQEVHAFLDGRSDGYDKGWTDCKEFAARKVRGEVNG